MTDDKRQELLSKAKPILFNTEMVRAILDGRKIITRRVVKPQPVVLNSLVIPPYKVSDILYVGETFSELKFTNGNRRYVYKATDKYPFDEKYIVKFKWHPSIHMPKEAARIFLRVMNVRAERLQEITDEDIVRDFDLSEDAIRAVGRDCIAKEVWNSVIKKSDLDKYGWTANPWVWVIEFERIDENV